MRKIALIVLAALTAIIPSAASAQKIDLGQILGVVSVGTSLGYNSCSYVRGSAGKAFCQVNRVANAANTVNNVVQRDRYRKQQQFNQRQQQLTALQRACQAGDSESCARSGGADSKQMTVARALMDACTAGDKRSCQRAEAMMDERNVSSYAAPRATQVAYARRDCPLQPVYDANGQRIAGEYVCR